MRIGHALMAYRQTVRAQAALTLAADAAWCERAGREHVAWYQDLAFIEQSRNKAVVVARQKGCDVLVMQDADCFSLSGPLLDKALVGLSLENAAVCGLAFMARVHSTGGTTGLVEGTYLNERLNCSLSEANQAYYDGQVGAGYMAIDLRKLRDLPLPWFVPEFSADGSGIVKSENIAFCDKVVRNGWRVIVSRAADTGHGFEGVFEHARQA